ncbi:hypothetical protein [Sanguibacter sp. HDW7]|uniref:hypothetical protein n=1 Tax=Sanguibacter sp. HDW7 TaxID=2714931 RepID=UPI001407E214|nr:hypothetical protein [Sanguibacter sp. HDW7]QIK82568.1 hypothetical protein G7063_02230 [Sanguibacter sp. HDW7]
MTTHDDAHANPPEEPTADAAADETAAAAVGASAGAAADGTAAREGSAHAQSSGSKGRALWIAAGAAVLVVAATVVAIVLNQPEEPVAAPTTPPAVTITNPLPTPVGTPAERETKRPLEKAFPDAVLQWTVATQERTKVAKKPLESYRLTYTDGAGGTVTVDVVQTRTVEAAVKASTQAADDETPLSAGSTVAELPVLVGTTEVGTASIATGGEVGLAYWTNGTTSFRATGPGAAIESFFLAFPM